MIIKGKSRTGPVALAKHLGNAEKNERVSLFELRGVVAQDLKGALVEMDALAVGTRCQKPLYHAAISPEPPHKLTDRQIDIAANTLELELGLTGHPRVIVIHEKLGREHIHVVWSRIDLENMRTVSDSHNYRKHEIVARTLEKQFGHERVQGAHHERDGVERPDRTLSSAELRQQERSGIRVADVKRDLSEAFRSSDSPGAFQTALEQMGYVLARGDKRDFVAVDPSCGVHSLAKRIDGVKTADLRRFMSPMDSLILPTVAQAKAFQNERDARALFRDYIEGHKLSPNQFRRPLEEEDLRDSAKNRKRYGEGEDYVSQSEAALHDHQQRQDKLNATEGGLTPSKQRKLDRLRASFEEDLANSDDLEPDRQPKAPGRGPTRSR